jgi:hypothetical protein
MHMVNEMDELEKRLTSLENKLDTILALLKRQDRAANDGSPPQTTTVDDI